jgi:SET domain-containing protein
MGEETFGSREIRPPAEVVIRPAPGKGRGVFATGFFASGTIIEECPVIVLTPEDRPRIDETEIFHYYLAWGPEERQAAIVLGWGSLYNHSFEPNARYVKDLDQHVLEVVALRDIEPGEEITVNSNGDPTSRKPVWLEAVE